MLIHRGKFIQSGRGLGSFFNSIARTILPGLSSFFQSQPAQQILHSAKDSAIKAGLHLASDTLKGENVGDSLKKQLKSFGEDVGSSIHNNLVKTPKKPKTQTSKKRKNPKPIRSSKIKKNKPLL